MTIHVAGTDPYPWPYDGCLAASRIALVRCGWQDHWATISHETEVVAARLAAVADAVLAVGGLVVDLRHGCASGQSRRLPAVGSAGWNRYEADTGALLIDAAGTDGCFGSALESQLWALGCRRVVLGGFAAEITVDSTLRSLNDRGFECLVLRDACAPIDPLLLERSLHSTTMSGGIFGAVGTTGALIDALEEMPA